MVSITRKVEVTVQMSPFDMGRAFAEMFSDEQAQFFNGIAAVTDDWPKDAGFQWVQMVSDMDGLPDALRAFQKMAEYASEPAQ